MNRSSLSVIAALLMLIAAPLRAEQFITQAVKAELAGEVLRFDLSAVPSEPTVLRAILRVPERGHQTGVGVRVLALPQSEPLKLRPPDYLSFDATAATRAAAAARKVEFRIAQRGGVDLRAAVLEVSYLGKTDQPIAPVTGLNALHQSGQTFLTWREIEDPVGNDAPTFEQFDKAVLEARAKRKLVYRVYRHAEPITVSNLGRAELTREGPEVISCWNLKAIRNTEHPNQGTPTKNSPLRPGYNLALNHIMTRYRITASGEPLPRATGLAVFTVEKPGKHFYAVTTAIDGREAVAELGAGASLQEAVDEKTATFPATIYQQTVSPDPKQKQSCDIDVYNSWIGPPYNNLPAVSEIFIVRWRNLPKATADARMPVMVNIGTYGGSATEAASPSWHDARRDVKGAMAIALAEGDLWQGFHECIGMLRGYDDGVVHNYPQRRVLAASAWGVANPDLLIDPERVYLWGQLASWGLRYGDTYAAVLSNGYGNLAIGKLAQQHGWKWGPYPKGCKNWLGIDQWEYMNLAKWIRENPSVELPYWLCWPAYGAYPAHTIGDFGFMPWPEMIHAMASTKRAFAANWSSNGPGPAGPLRDLVHRIRLHQSLPAFSNCSLDHSPGDGDHDDAEKGGGINLYQIWEPETIVDEADRWEITLMLRGDCPRPQCITDLTPRRCQRFRAKPGESFRWTHTTLADNRVIQSGTSTADKCGLVTVEKLTLRRERTRVRISR